jgi:O-antigen/teichoic acid export membrane protein
VLKNISSNWVVIAATILVSYVLTPFSIDVLGAEGYGLWLVVTSLTAYIYLVRGGLPAASVRYLAEQIGRGDYLEANRVVASCLALYVVLAAIVVVGGGAMLLVFESTYDSPPGFAWQVRPTFVLAVGTVVVTFFAHLPYAIMEAHDEFVIKNRIVLGALVLRLVLVLVLLSLHATLPMMALALFSCALFELLVGFAVVRVRYPELRFSLRERNRALRGQLIKFGAHLLVLSFGAQLAFQSDALVIGAFLPFSDVASYSVANSLVLYLVALVTAIAWVVMPRATKLHATGQAGELRSVFLRWSKIAFSLSLAVGLYLFFLGPEFLGWWIDDSFKESAGPILQVLVVCFLVYLPVRGVAIPILMGLGKVAKPSLAFLVMGAVNVAISIALVGPLGLMGAALGTGVPIVVFAAAVLRMTLREVDVTLPEYLVYVFGRPLAGAAPVASVLAAFKYGAQVQGFTGLFLAGVSMLAVFALVWLLFVYRHDPHLDLALRIRHRFGKTPQSATE